MINSLQKIMDKYMQPEPDYVDKEKKRIKSNGEPIPWCKIR